MWERPRATYKLNNAPESGGSFYTCLARKVADPVLDYKSAETKYLPPLLKDLDSTSNYR